MRNERKDAEPRVFVPADEMVKTLAPLAEKVAGGIQKIGRAVDRVMDKITTEKFEHDEVPVSSGAGDVYQSPHAASAD